MLEHYLHEWKVEGLTNLLLMTVCANPDSNLWQLYVPGTSGQRIALEIVPMQCELAHYTNLVSGKRIEPCEDCSLTTVIFINDHERLFQCEFEFEIFLFHSKKFLHNFLNGSLVFRSNILAPNCPQKVPESPAVKIVFCCSMIPSGLRSSGYLLELASLKLFSNLWSR